MALFLSSFSTSCSRLHCALVTLRLHPLLAHANGASLHQLETTLAEPPVLMGLLKGHHFGTQWVSYFISSLIAVDPWTLRQNDFNILVLMDVRKFRQTF